LDSARDRPKDPNRFVSTYLGYLFLPRTTKMAPESSAKAGVAPPALISGTDATAMAIVETPTKSKSIPVILNMVYLLS